MVPRVISAEKDDTEIMSSHAAPRNARKVTTPLCWAATELLEQRHQGALRL
jgi:hypothetical protein